MQTVRIELRAPAGVGWSCLSCLKHPTKALARWPNAPASISSPSSPASSAAPVDEDDAAEAEVAVDVLDFLDHACKATGCEPGWTAKLTVLDLARGIVGFGAARNVEELVQWLREEVPGRAPRTHEGGREQQGRVQRRAAVFVPVYAAGGELALSG